MKPSGDSHKARKIAVVEQHDPQRVYVAISDLDVGDTCIDFGEGVRLSPVYAHLFSSNILAFERPPSIGMPHPGPWQSVYPNSSVDISAELIVPGNLVRDRATVMETPNCIVRMLRLWVDPRITIQFASSYPIAKLRDLNGTVGSAILLRREQTIPFAPILPINIPASLEWVVKSWKQARNLYETSPEFRLALDTFESAFRMPTEAMMLVSIWGALEALFARTRGEVTFRVSSNLAAYLVPRGVERVTKQKEIQKLYSARSHAAHGKPKHQSSDVLNTFELLRAVLVRIIDEKTVPTEETLRTALFET